MYAYALNTPTNGARPMPMQPPYQLPTSHAQHPQPHQQLGERFLSPNSAASHPSREQYASQQAMMAMMQPRLSGTPSGDPSASALGVAYGQNQYYANNGGAFTFSPSSQATQSVGAGSGMGTAAAASPSIDRSNGTDYGGDVIFYVMVPNGSGEYAMRPVYGPGRAGVSEGGASLPTNGGTGGNTHHAFPASPAMMRAGPRDGVAPTFTQPTGGTANTMMMSLSQLSSANAQTLWQTKGLSAMSTLSVPRTPPQGPPLQPRPPHQQAAAHGGRLPTSSQGNIFMSVPGTHIPMAMPSSSDANLAAGARTSTAPTAPGSATSKKALKKKKKCNGVQYVVGHIYEGFVKRYNPLRGFGFLTATHELVPASVQGHTQPNPHAPVVESAEGDAFAAIHDPSTFSTEEAPSRTTAPLHTKPCSPDTVTTTPTATVSQSEPGMSTEGSTNPFQDDRTQSTPQDVLSHAHSSAGSGSHGEHRSTDPHNPSLAGSASPRDEQKMIVVNESEGFPAVLTTGQTVMVRRERSSVGDIFVHQSYVHMRGFRALPVGGRVRFEIGYLEGQQSLQAVDVRLLDVTPDASVAADPSAVSDAATVATPSPTPADAPRAFVVPATTSMPKPEVKKGQQLFGFLSNGVPSAVLSTYTPASQTSDDEFWLETDELLKALTRD